MTAAIEAGPAIFRPSRFWTDLGRTHREQLLMWGFDSFKRTVNTRYFNWRIAGILRHQLGVVGDWLRHPDAAIFGARFPKPSSGAGSTIGGFNAPSAWIYKTFVAQLADLVSRRDPLGLLMRIEEPAVGDPFSIRYRDRDLSQDLCNSVHELYSIFGADGGPIAAGIPIEVMELGAGYGRLAHVVLAASSGVSYTIVDVPPALYLSQRYLTNVHPEVRTFRFREWDDFEDVRSEYAQARIRFLLPHQAELLPSKAVDYFVNISSLHEMSRPQVERYFQLMDRLCRGRVYTKQWRISRARVNQVVFHEDDYPVPPAWLRVFHRRHPIQRMFFEALYEVR